MLPGDTHREWRGKWILDNRKKAPESQGQRLWTYSWHSSCIGEGDRGKGGVTDQPAAGKSVEISRLPTAWVNCLSWQKYILKLKTTHRQNGNLLPAAFLGLCSFIPLTWCSYNLILLSNMLFILFDFLPATLIWQSRCFITWQQWFSIFFFYDDAFILIVKIITLN